MKSQTKKNYEELIGLIETIPKIKARIAVLTKELAEVMPDKGEDSGVKREDKQWIAVDYKKAFCMAYKLTANKVLLNHCLDVSTSRKSKPMFYDKE